HDPDAGQRVAVRIERGPLYDAAGWGEFESDLGPAVVRQQVLRLRGSVAKGPRTDRVVLGRGAHNESPVHVARRDDIRFELDLSSGNRRVGGADDDAAD